MEFWFVVIHKYLAVTMAKDDLEDLFYDLLSSIMMHLQFMRCGEGSWWYQEPAHLHPQQG